MTNESQNPYPIEILAEFCKIMIEFSKLNDEDEIKKDYFD